MGKPPLKFGKVHYVRPRMVPFAELIGDGRFRGREHFGRLWSNDERVCKGIRPQTTSRDRYPWHNTFLRKKRAKIRSFADIGCALSDGAPTTIEAREILPRGARVLAVDIVKAPDPNNLKELGIEVLDNYFIADGPLSEPVDAIRFALVSIYLPKRQVRRSLKHIRASLNEGGFLMSNRYIYQLTKRGFRLIATEGDQS